MGTLPGPVGAGFTPGDGSVLILAKAIASWLVAQLTTAHAELIPSVDWEINVLGKAGIPISAVGIVAIRRDGSDGGQSCQALRKDSACCAGARHCLSGRARGFESKEEYGKTLREMAQGSEDYEDRWEMTAMARKILVPVGG